MGMDILKETGASRTPGSKIKAGEEAMPGFVALFEDAETLIVYNDKAKVPSGLFMQSNVHYPAFDTAAPDGTPVGDGFEFLNYNRGGLIGLFRAGGTVLLYDDKRKSGGASHPVDYTKAYNVNDKCYADQNTGKVTSTLDTNRQEIGIVEKVVGSGVNLVLKMRLSGTLA